MSDTKNVKIGVCRVIYDSIDLGYTKGGVEVSVTTETHKVQVDQFGKSTVNELVMGREVKVKAPLAETTIDNLVRIMPGATKVGSAGVPQISTVTVTASTTIASITADGTKYESVPDADGTVGEHCLALVAQINSDPTSRFTASTTATPASTNGTVVLTGKLNAPYVVTAVGGNVVQTQAATVDNFRVDVASGVGLDLLSTARELRLHPVDKPNDDTSEDFVIPLAGTGGGLQFAYKLEEERIFQVEFTGYPHPSTGRLFYVGNKNAI